MEIALRFVSSYVLLFFVFSVFGWCMEVTLKYIQYHRFINRGFLIGPYCPIYGSGAVFISLTVGLCENIESSYGITFLISLFVCGALEYFVSYYLEKHFHARWWDYSTKPMNLNGRIWIGNLLLFGLGGTIIIKVLDPFLFKLFYRLSDETAIVMSGIILAAMGCDYIASHFIMKFVKTSIENSEADDTEAISKEIRLLLKDRSLLHKRIADAYPDVIYKTERITQKMQEVKAEMDRIKEEAVSHVEAMEEIFHEQKQTIVSMMETASVIKDDIIQKQDALIILLEAGIEHGSVNEAEIKAAYVDIESRKQQLENKKKLFLLK